MQVVSEIDDPFIPMPDDLIVNLHDSRAVVDNLLSTLPQNFAHNLSADSAMGPALQAAFLSMSNLGGKLLLFQAAVPSLGQYPALHQICSSFPDSPAPSCDLSKEPHCIQAEFACPDTGRELIGDSYDKLDRYHQLQSCQLMQQMFCIIGQDYTHRMMSAATYSADLQLSSGARADHVATNMTTVICVEQQVGCKVSPSTFNAGEFSLCILYLNKRTMQELAQ